MLKKKKGNNPNNSGSGTSNHTGGNIKVRNQTAIPAVAELDSGGFDDPPSASGCSNKTQIYSTTV